MLEHEGHGAVGAHVAAVLGEGVTDFGHRAHPVVGQAIHHHRRTADAVALVADLLVADALEFAGALLDGVLDLVLGHVHRLALIHGQTQARVEARVAAAHLGGHGDFLGDLGEGGTALFVLAPLAMLDVGPFGMAGHNRFLIAA